MPPLGTDPLLKQLEYILELLEKALDFMDEIGRVKGQNVLWRLFLPYAEFHGRKSRAKQASAILLDIHMRLQDMEKTLLKQNHPLTGTIQELNYLDLREMSDRLAEVPERSQYMGIQIDELRFKVEQVVNEIKKNSSH